MQAAIDILECGHAPSEHSEYTTGYGRDAEGRRSCYSCCAELERVSMIETGRAMLYLVKRDGGGFGLAVTDWAGHLQFSVGGHARGHHNIARTRDDVWFRGPDGFIWHGVSYGGNTQIVHCKRTKQTKW